MLAPVQYCCDNNDRLTATTPTGSSASASLISGSALSTVGPNATLAYDARGNTTVLADQTLLYDMNDNHKS